MNKETKERWLDLLWDSLKKDPRHRTTHRQTGWGVKTKIGLLACVGTIIKETKP